jgi:hypothetical protein
MTLPATYQGAIESQALAFAIDWLGIRRQEGVDNFLNLDCAPLDPEAGHRLVRRLLQHCAMGDDRAMSTITELARVWDEADIAMRNLIIELNANHQPLPVFLEAYNARIVAGFVTKRARGRKKATHFLQDFVLALLIVLVRAKFPGFKETRYQGGKKLRASYCSIVAGAAAAVGLNRGDEGAIQQIWRRWQPIIDRAGLEQIIVN